MTLTFGTILHNHWMHSQRMVKQRHNARVIKILKLRIVSRHSESSISPASRILLLNFFSFKFFQWQVCIICKRWSRWRLRIGGNEVKVRIRKTSRVSRWPVLLPILPTHPPAHRPLGPTDVCSKSIDINGFWSGAKAAKVSTSSWESQVETVFHEGVVKRKTRRCLSRWPNSGKNWHLELIQQIIFARRPVVRCISKCPLWDLWTRGQAYVSLPDGLQGVVMGQSEPFTFSLIPSSRPQRPSWSFSGLTWFANADSFKARYDLARASQKLWLIKLGKSSTVTAFQI